MKCQTFLVKNKGCLALKKLLGHLLKLGKKLEHFGSNPLPPDKNFLIYNYEKLGFQIDPLPPYLSPMSLIFSFFDGFP